MLIGLGNSLLPSALYIEINCPGTALFTTLALASNSSHILNISFVIFSCDLITAIVFFLSAIAFFTASSVAFFAAFCAASLAASFAFLSAYSSTLLHIFSSSSPCFISFVLLDIFENLSSSKSVFRKHCMSSLIRLSSATSVLTYTDIYYHCLHYFSNPISHICQNPCLYSFLYAQAVLR